MKNNNFSMVEEQKKDEEVAKVNLSKRISEILSAFQTGRYSKADAQIEICKAIQKWGR